MWVTVYDHLSNTDRVIGGDGDSGRRVISCELTTDQVIGRDRV